MDSNNSYQNSNLDKIEEAAFRAVYHRILKEIKSSDEDGELLEAHQWFCKALDYNIPFGKLNRGLFLVQTYSLLNNNSRNNIERVMILGWSLEFLQTFILIFDDIMDSSITRREKLCWYQNVGVGNIALNDALIMENTCYYLVKQHFGNEKYYTDIINLIFDILRKTGLGQCLDLLSFQVGLSSKPNLTKYTMERYSSIVKYKTSYYSFCLPVQLAMLISGIKDSISHEIANKILLKIGEYYQIQDDMLDCFGDPKVIGKIGTDIEDGKCCWPIVTAIMLANRQQYKVLEWNYGIKNRFAVENVKRVYKELNLENKFNIFSENRYKEIWNDIEGIDKSNKLPLDIFFSLLNKIHKRQK